MNSFVNPGYPTEHGGVARVEAAARAVRHFATGFQAAKGLAAMLLAGGISAFVVVADQIVRTWTDGHLLLAWIAMWALVFTALALFAQSSEGLATRLINTLRRWQRAQSQRASDEQVWALALADSRFMAELQAIRLRGEEEALASGQPMPVWPFSYMPMRPRRADRLY